MVDGRENIEEFGENSTEKNTHVLHIINMMSNVNDTSLSPMKLFPPEYKEEVSNQEIKMKMKIKKSI